MTKLELSPLYVVDMKLNNCYPLFKTTIEISIPYRLFLGPIENAALDELIATNEAMGTHSNKNQKSEYTIDLNLFEKERISFWKEIVRINNSYLKSANPVKKAAAQKVDFFIAPYKGIPDLPLNSKTGTIAEMLGKYKTNAEVMAASKEVGLDTSFDGLETKNKSYDAQYKVRNDQYAAQEESGSALKPAAVAGYNQFCTAIQQAANLTPNESNVALFHKMDELRKKYHALESNVKDAPAADAAPAK